VDMMHPSSEPKRMGPLGLTQRHLGQDGQSSRISALLMTSTTQTSAHLKRPLKLSNSHPFRGFFAIQKIHLFGSLLMLSPPFGSSPALLRQGIGTKIYYESADSEHFLIASYHQPTLYVRDQGV
jgi:hypothetical protein